MDEGLRGVRVRIGFNRGGVLFILRDEDENARTSVYI